MAIKANNIYLMLCDIKAIIYGILFVHALLVKKIQ